MLWGVPLTPLLSVSGTIFLISVWTHIYLLVLLFPTFIVLKLMTKIDDFIFHLYFLKIKMMMMPASKKYYGGIKTYHNTEYRSMPPKIDYPTLSIIGLDKNPSFEKYLPFSSLISEDVVLTKSYMLISTFRVEGVAFEIENDDTIDHSKHILNMLFKAFANEPISFYFHNARHSLEDHLKAEYSLGYLKEIDELYNKGLENSLRANSLFLTVIYNPFMHRIERSNFAKYNGSKKHKMLEIYLKKMHDYLDRIESNLQNFKPKRLKIYEHEGKQYSTQLEFYNYLLGGRFHKVRALNAPLTYITGGLRNIQFSGDLMQLNYGTGEKQFAKAIEFKDYVSETFAGILDALMYLNINYTITQSFAPLPKIEAKEKLKRQEKHFISSEDDSRTQLEQFGIAQDELTNGDICFGNYHFSILIFGDSIEEVKKNTNTVVTKLNEMGFIASSADIALPATFFAQLPSNFALRPRVSAITSKNYSDLIALHNFPKGRREGNAWGDAITILKTPNGQPYYFNLHEIASKNDFGNFPLGNTLSVGQSGGGKTAFAANLCNQLLKFDDPKTFPDNIPDQLRKITIIYLDKDYGAMGNILAAGGRYVTLENGQPTGFNPFMIESTEANKRNLQILIKVLITRNGELLTSSDEKKLNSAIDFVMDNFIKEDRKFGISLLLENLTEDINDENSLKSRLELWKKGNKFGWVFDNEYDLLDFPDEIKIFGIDGTEFLDDKEVSAPISHYILMRSMSLVDGRRFALFMDEAWKWLENELVADETKNKLKTIRKQNGLFYLASQSAEDFLKMKIAAAIVEQCATQIFFANSKATKKDYIDGLSTTPEEFNTIKNFIVSEYKCLIKQNGTAAVVSLDLSSLGSLLNILSTGAAHVDAIKQIFKEDISLDEKVAKLKAYYAKSKTTKEDKR